MKRIFGSKTDKITGVLRKLRNKRQIYLIFSEQ
jgi:hypothetical protein